MFFWLRERQWVAVSRIIRVSMGYCIYLRIETIYDHRLNTLTPNRTTMISAIAMRAIIMIQHILHLLFSMLIFAFSMLTSAWAINSLARRTLSATSSIFYPDSLVSMPII